MSKDKTPGLRGVVLTFVPPPDGPQNMPALVAKAMASGLPTAVLPGYAGDRKTVRRAVERVAATTPGFQLRPVRQKSHYELSFAIDEVRETAEGVRLRPRQVGRLDWKALDNKVRGQHRVAKTVRAEYEKLQGEVTAEDWTTSLTSYLLEACFAVPLRSDGRLYWVPGRKAQHANALCSLVLAAGGRALAIRTDESGMTELCGLQALELTREHARGLLQALEAEISGFTGRQHAGTYKRRLESCAQLRRMLDAYEAAGIKPCVPAAAEALQRAEDRLHELHTQRVARMCVRGPRPATRAKPPRPEAAPAQLVVSGIPFRRGMLSGQTAHWQAAAERSIEARELLSRLQLLGIEVKTASGGDVRFATDGTRTWIQSQGLPDAPSLAEELTLLGLPTTVGQA